jgi:hypothetical protein
LFRPRRPTAGGRPKRGREARERLSRVRETADAARYRSCVIEPKGSDAPTVPVVTVYDPQGAERARIELSGEQLSVGRLPEVNDVALEPDPDQLVTRKQHCILLREGSRWYVADQRSANGTFVRREGELVRISEETQLNDGDVVCIAGRIERRRPRYWELVYTDKTRTQVLDLPGVRSRLMYERNTGRLMLVQQDDRVEISLRPQARKLVLHMATRNSQAGDEAVLCLHDELMEAVWGGEPFHTRNDLARLFWELRRELEPRGGEDFVEAVRGVGYRLWVTVR